MCIKPICLFINAGSIFVGITTHAIELKDDSQQTCIYKIDLYSWFLIISDHWGTKDTENQHSDSMIPRMFGDQATNSDKNSIR